jgi:REP element-mobilizing transposase RayT
VCESREVVIVGGSVSPDHVHMLVRAPPHLSAAKLVQHEGSVEQDASG